MTLRGTVVSGGGSIVDGVVVVDGGTIVHVGPAAEVPPQWRDLLPPPGDDLLLPGLIDVHCHGGGGGSFPDAGGAQDVRTAAREHLVHGTTSLVASLVTAPAEDLIRRAALLADAVDAGDLIGIHLEGPFLSPARRGAQNPADMVAGDPGLVGRIAAAARGSLRTMTVAPEIPGVADGVGAGDDVLGALVQAGALPSIGHTDASFEQTAAAIGRSTALLAGSRRITATHLFNGMRPWHHREPGPVPACLDAAARGALVVELVADGTHLGDGTVRTVFDTLGAEQVVLVTDAMAAAGMADGDYRLGPLEVRVADGVARLITSDGSVGAIAGGTAHLLDVVRSVVGAGVAVADAVSSATRTPARLLGLVDRGELAPGLRADVLVTDPDLHPRRVIRTGVEV
ncbi:MAG: amidohydrolase family protein [Actinobacteria bacterium]|nr:amidohydrolase family protein [Actinomycetota bacterium]